MFLSGSYGFRPGRNCHDAVRDLEHHLYRNPVQSVIDVDLANFFDPIDHDLLLGMLREKINDPKRLRYMQRMFKSGVLAAGELTVGNEGVPQGSLCSPVLANIFAHNVIDVWLEDLVKRHCAGKVAWFRYADDMVICCEYEHDALRVRKALGGRLARYKLALNVNATFTRSDSVIPGRRRCFPECEITLLDVFSQIAPIQPYMNIQEDPVIASFR